MSAKTGGGGDSHRMVVEVPDGAGEDRPLADEGRHIVGRGGGVDPELAGQGAEGVQGEQNVEGVQGEEGMQGVQEVPGGGGRGTQRVWHQTPLPTLGLRRQQ